MASTVTLESIAASIADLKLTMDKKFEEQEKKFDQKLDQKIQMKFDAFEKKLNKNLDKRFATFKAEIIQVIETKIEALEISFRSTISSFFDITDNKFDQVKRTFRSIENAIKKSPKFDGLSENNTTEYESLNNKEIEEKEELLRQKLQKK